MNPNMLLVEDDQTGDFCCDLQRDHIAQIAKLQAVLSGRQQRLGGVIALGSRRVELKGTDRGGGRSQRKRLSPAQTIMEQPVLNLESIETLLMADRPRTRKFNGDGKQYHKSAWCFLAVGSPIWQGGTVQIGDEGIDYNCDFFKMPRKLTQKARGPQTISGTLRSPVAGNLSLRRLGRYLDVCVGEYSTNELTICFRFHIADFLPSERGGPLARVMNVRPEVIGALENGEPHYTDIVFQAYEKLVESNRPITYVPADVDEEYVSTELIRDTLDASRRPIFRTALEMSEQLTKGLNYAARLSEIRILVEFPVRKLGSFVVGKFIATPALSRDLLASLGPDGLVRGTERIKLKVTADTTSRIRAIHRSESAVTIMYENGCEQTLPPTVQLTKLEGDNLVDLAAGMEVSVSEPLGDYINRFEAKSCDYPELAGLLGPSIVGALEALITRTSIINKKVAQGMLVDYQYAEPYLDKSVDKLVSQKTYLDCSTLVDLYEPESRFIIIPVSSPTYPLWELTSSSLSIVFARRKPKRYFTRTEGDGKVVEGEEEIPDDDENEIVEDQTSDQEVAVE